MTVVRGKLGIVVFGLFLGCSGCSATTISISSLLADGRDNELAAMEKYEGETFSVTGTVKEVGLQKFKQRVLHVTPAFGGGAHGYIGEQRQAFPYVVLAPEDDSSGVLMCWFDKSARGTVAKVDKGSTVTLSGKFQEYTHGRRLIVVFNSCSVESTIDS